jgi:hypothetical protein
MSEKIWDEKVNSSPTANEEEFAERSHHGYNHHNRGLTIVMIKFVRG